MKGLTPWEKTAVAVLVTFVWLMFINCSGQVWLLEVPWLLLTGWVGFLERALPEVTLRWEPIVETVGVLLLLGVVMHRFLRWAWRYPRAGWAPWPLRWSVMVVVLVVLLFGATLAMVGMGQHLGWLVSGRKGMAASTWRRTAEALMKDGSNLCYEALRWSASGVAEKKLVQVLLRVPETRSELERLHVVPLRGPEGEPGFVVFPRDPDLLEGVGAMRCWEGLEEAEFVHSAMLPPLLWDSRATARKAR